MTWIRCRAWRGVLIVAAVLLVLPSLALAAGQMCPCCARAMSAQLAAHRGAIGAPHALRAPAGARPSTYKCTCGTPGCVIDDCYCQGPVTAVPAVNPWGLGLLGLAALGAGAIAVRRLMPDPSA
ncbi:MAG TPA: IPTL-CTERM sorting domain-containing protein [Candidatus Saccharimonadales bacterium]|nr:IPTL-CTERM sorting domain-containing protein [Candidatus Saccharimonadales bacterium]